MAAGLLTLAGSASAVAAAEGDAARGRALYLGDAVMSVRDDDGVRALPRAACVQCHRRSGLGSFEGSLAAPPIAGHTLFRPYDRDTGGFFREGRRDRVRPAYDEAALHALLATGTAPDGYAVRAPMPRYVLAPADAADLAAYLRSLARPDAPGLDAQRIRLATVFTPTADAASRRAMEEVMRRFVAQKNAQTRQDTRRSQQAERSHEMAMSRKFRTWELDVWALDGESHTWAAQLERFDRERPVFAVVAGIGRDDWAPVHRFCEERRMPCLLPWLDEAPVALDGGDFYSLYFHPGHALDLPLAAAALRDAGARRVQVWGDAPLPARLQPLLAQAGVTIADAGAHDAVLSLLPPARHLERLAAAGAAAGVVAWVPGRHPVTVDEWTRAAAPLSRGVFVTPLRLPGAAGASAWPRAATWLRQQGLAWVPPEVGAATLQALTTLGDTLVHIDFEFTRDYALELLEHGLENRVAYGPYERLAVAPGQRIGAKGSHVALVQGGRMLPWTWQVTPAALPARAGAAQKREITTTEASARPLR